jgi:Trypsin-like peptidase domain/Effector-associated domain 1
MLTTQTLHTLHRALLEAFDPYDFEHLLRSRLGLRPELLTTPREVIPARWVFEVLQTAERAGWTHDLVRAAYEARPNRQDLATIYQDLGLATDVSVQHAGTAMAEAPTTLTAEGFERIFPSAAAIDIGVWREQLAVIEARVCRMEVGGSSMGTGFLVGPDAVLTCYHVVQDVIQGRQSPEIVRCRFDYRVLTSGLTEGMTLTLHPTDWLIDFSPYSPSQTTGIPDATPPTVDTLNYALLRVARPIGMEPLDPSTGSGPPRGWIRVPDSGPALVPKMPLAIISYAGGGPLKLAIDTEGVIGSNDNDTRVQYATETEPGSSGAPCFNIHWGLVAMHELRLAEQDPGHQYEQGIAIAAIRDRLKRLGKAAAFGGEPPGSNDSLSPARAHDSKPPEPGPVLYSYDLQKGRWGGLSARNGRQVTVELQEVMHTFFLFNVSVTSTDGSSLQGPVIFHLHDSYRPSVIRVSKINENKTAVLEKVSSYGVYTIGVQVKDAQGDWIGLELDLAKLDGLPDRFLLL